MVIVLEIALAIGLVALVVNLLLRGRREARREELMAQRVEAYMLTIRREGRNAELVAMSDPELRDLLLSSAHNLRIQSDRRWFLLVGGLILGFFAAIMVATAEGTKGFGIALVVVTLVIYGLNEFVERRMRAPLERRGIDVERLRVE